MQRRNITLAIATAVTIVMAAPLDAQKPGSQPDPLIAAVGMGNAYVQHQLTLVAGAMSEEDYAFKPTPEVRSFGQLLAHIADSNYLFCSEASDEDRPARGVEKTKIKKADIDKALTDSFTYCGQVYAAMTEAKARTIVQFGNQPLPALAVLIFKTVHNAQHYGNVTTYMRLLGKVPPPAAR